MTASLRTRTVPDPPSLRMTWLYIAALSFVALLTIVGQVVTQRSIARQLDDSRIVNLAGRQRMLSQRLTQLALRLEREPSSEKRQELRQEYAEAFASWTTTHEGLRYGSESLDLSANDSVVVEAMFADLDQVYLPMRQAGEATLEASSDPPQVERISAATQDWLARESAFLGGMDAIVFQYDSEARERVARLRLIEAALLIATLSTLAAEAFFVFRPAVRSISRYVEELRNLNAELVRTERRAVEADAAKTQFLAGMSHELRTPMSAILGAAELSLERTDDPAAKRLLAALHQSAKSLSGMLDELLDLASFDAGAGPTIVSEPFAVRAAIESAADLFRPNAERKGLQFVLSVDDDVPASAIGDEKRLGQILSNLLSNAIKFTDEGSVSVRASVEPRDGDFVRLNVEVIDTGPGVPREHAERIFERFTRVDPSLRRRTGGAGLGLAISSELATAMSGTIQLDLDRTSGSRFVLRLPLGVDASSATRTNEGVAASPTTEVPPVAGPASISDPQPTRRALIADDSESNRLLLAERLRDLGFAVTEAANGSQALEAARADSFDAILLDLEMPGLDGIEAARSMRRERPGNDAKTPRLIAVTAHPPNAVRDRCLEAGFDAFLSKPVGTASLLDELGPDLSPRRSATERRLEDAPASESAIRIVTARFARREQLLLRLIELYFDESEGLKARLRAAAERQDRRAFAETVHRWKGTCANFGFAEVDERFADFEGEIVSDATLSPIALSPLLASIETLEVALRQIGSDLGRKSDLVDDDA